jgi:hypothetical protein
MHADNARLSGVSLRDGKVGAQPKVGDAVNAKWKGVSLIVDNVHLSRPF